METAQRPKSFAAVVPLEEPPRLGEEPTASALVAFGGQNFAVLETVGLIRLPVCRTGSLGLTVHVDFCTRDGTAKCVEDYVAAGRGRGGVPWG